MNNDHQTLTTTTDEACTCFDDLSQRHEMRALHVKVVFLRTDPTNCVTYLSCSEHFSCRYGRLGTQAVEAVDISIHDQEMLLVSVCR
jgi:hypothetical protein